MSEKRRKTVEIIYTIDFEKFYDYTRYVDVADMNAIISEVEAKTIQKLKDKFMRNPAEIAVYASLAVVMIVIAFAIIYFITTHGSGGGGGTLETVKNIMNTTTSIAQLKTPITQTITQIVNGTTTTITTTITP